MLTSADVEQKTFSTALRGYDLDEVDDFLDEVAATLRELNEKLATAEAAAVSPPPVPTAGEPQESRSTDVDETAISRALIAAQNAADKLLEDAKSEANKIVDDAKGEADTWEAEREAKRRQAQDEIAALAARVASVRTELSVLAGEVTGKLDQMDEVIESSGTASISDDDAGDDDEHAVYDSASRAEVGIVSEGSHEAKPDEIGDMLNDVASDLQLDASEDDDEESDENR
jgi:cell division initiation protein